jgi:hypothetical protein
MSKPAVSGATCCLYALLIINLLGAWSLFNVPTSSSRPWSTNATIVLLLLLLLPLAGHRSS